MADLAGDGHSPSGPQLQPLLQEHDLGSVDDVRLNAVDVNMLLDVTRPHHVVIGRSPYLERKKRVRPGRTALPFGFHRQIEKGTVFVTWTTWWSL